MTLPKASELDAWLAGYVVGYRTGPDAGECHEDLVAGVVHLLHFTTLRWLRAHNDAVVATCPNLPDLERRYSVATTPEAKREALRALLAARDAVIAAKPAHDAVQAQAVMPLRLGMHPLGFEDKS